MQASPGGPNLSTFALLAAALKDPAWRAKGWAATRARLGSWLAGLAVIAALAAGCALLYGLARHAAPWLGAHALRAACAPFSCDDRDWREVDLPTPQAAKAWREAISAISGQDPANSRSESELAARWREGAPAGALYAREATLDEFKRQAGRWLDARAVEAASTRQADDLRLATDWMRELARHGDPARAAKTAVEREGPRASDLAGDERFAQARAAEASVRSALAGLAASRPIKVSLARVAELSAPWRPLMDQPDPKRRAQESAVADDLFGLRLILGIPTMGLLVALAIRLAGAWGDATTGIEKRRQELSRLWEAQQVEKAAAPPKAPSARRRL